MRVLLVSDFVPPVRGGLEFHVQALGAALADRGHDVHVATLTAQPALHDARLVTHPIRAASSRLPHESPDRPFHPPLPDPLARRELGELLDRVQPDVVHAHSWLAVSLPRRRPPLVYTAHDYGLICPRRTLVRRDDTLCHMPHGCVRCALPVLGPVAAAGLGLGTPIGRRLLRPERLLAVSTAVATALAPHVRCPIEVVPNFVGPSPVREPLPAGLPEDGFALYAGDPGEHKGVLDLLDAWRAPHPPALPLVLATTRPLPPGILLPPNVYPTTLRRGQMVTAWERAGVALVPSRWADPCPTVALEAMRAGTPVVGTGHGGLGDLVRDGVEGLLIAPRDPEGIRASVDHLAGDPLLRRRLGRAAAARARDYTADIVVDRIVANYRGALAARTVSVS